MKNLKPQFPLFTHSPEIVYLDNAATTQKPKQVISAITKFYEQRNSNVHRGLYPLSENATQIYEAARKSFAKFIKSNENEIVFTSGATAALNIVAYGLQQTGNNLKVLLTELDHHSSLLPWKHFKNVEIEYIPFDVKSNSLDYKKVSGVNPDIVAVPLISNVTGEIINIDYLKKLFPQAVFIIDGSQAGGHIPVDVSALDVEFIVFGGHKMYGPMGTGVLYGKKQFLEKLTPVVVGGGMISSVTKLSTDWAKLPERLEAGTPNVAGAVGLQSAVEFILNVGFENITEHEQKLKKYLLEGLNSITGLNTISPSNSESIGVVSFYHDSAHAHDIAQFLGEQNVCVRAGHHCAQILHREVLQIPASVRVSLGMYNTKEDIDLCVSNLSNAIKKYI